MRITLSSLLCFLVSSLGVGQVPVANFTANATTGCSPLTVYFSDQSTGNPKYWNWDFGNGQLSNLQNPVVGFAKPGTYTVTLVVKNGDGVNGITKTNYITVNPSPSAGFKASSQLACAPTTIQFTDLSVANSGTIVAWKWVFSDGTTYNTQNVSKQFATPGFYDVNLTVTSSTGCQGGTGINRYIRIIPGLKVDFINSAPQNCRAPFPVNFTNQTSGPGNLTYNWDLGNGGFSTQKDPSTTYSAAGSYTVKLKAQSSLGCQDSIQKTITLAGKSTSFNAPATTCLNTPVTFQNTSAPTPASVLWDFGDGTQSTLLNPAKSFGTPGNYLVKLFATFANCTDSFSKNITVYGKPTVDFTATQTGTCNSPVIVNFKDASPDAVSWNWDFGDGGTSALKDPSHAYNSNNQYDVTLTITDSKGCQNTLTKPAFIKIVTTDITFTNLPAGGCGPSFTFTPTVIINAPGGVASYLWEFGDGGISNSANPSHTYTALGTYTLKLTITTNDGCTATRTYPGAVKVGSAVTVDFTKNAGVVCNSSGVTFTNLSAPPGDSWIWEFGDGDTSHKQNPYHKYSDTGYFPVSLTVINNGCSTKKTIIDFVHSLPPIANFSALVDCANKQKVVFTDKSKSKDPLIYLWKFGDPSIPNSTSQNNTIVYPGVGPYNVVLIVNNNICWDTAQKTLNLITELADFSMNKVNACKRDSIHFISLNRAVFVKQYAWSVNGINAGANAAKFDTSFPAVGVYTIGLKITDINGCVTTKNKTINITGPTAQFSIANKGGCVNSPVSFTDASLPAGGIQRWNWNFGDGSIKNFTAPPFTHIYTDTGNFTIKLIVLDTIGCTDTAVRVSGVRINRVKAAFSAEKTIFCQGALLHFTDSSYDKTQFSYLWNFGDGNTSAVQNPTHAYNGNDSTYTVKLVVRDTVGCTDSLIRPNYIRIVAPKAAFDVKDSTTICPPLETKFIFKGKNYESLAWDFGDGGTSVLPNPYHFYNNYDDYTAKLYVKGFGGCIDSASSLVSVHNPYSQTTISYPDTTVCNSVLMNFKIKIPASTRFYFYFGDGTLDSSQNLNPQHFYSIPSYYGPSLLLKDSLACQVGIGGAFKISVLGALPLFAKDRKAFCDSGMVYFTNYTIANDPVVSQTWSFGDGNSSTTKDAFNLYRQPGFYTPKLTVTTQAGCTNSTMDTIRVLRTPKPLIVSNNTSCNNLFVNFQGNLQLPDTAITWKWDLGNGKTSGLQNPSLNYSTPGTYHIKLEAVNSLGCKDTISKNITIFPAPAVTVTGDTSFIVSSGITIPFKYSTNVVSYNWTPPTYLSCTNCPNPFANPKFTTTYKVAVVDSNGCASSRNVTLISLCNDRNFFVPNTFSPNGDGVNDWFYPRGKGLDRIESIRIFNRWGEMVFERRNMVPNNEKQGWDGTYKGKPAGSDTYVYMIDLVCENAVIITYKGNVTLIR